MKKCGHFIGYIIVGVIMMVSVALGQTIEDQKIYSDQQWKQREQQRKLSEKYGADLSRIKPQELSNKAVKKVGMTVIKTEISFGGKIGSTMGKMWTVGEAAKRLRDAQRVGTGRADPTVLKPVIPHAVQAWDSMKGSENLPNQTFSIHKENNLFDDGATKIQTYTTKTIRQSYSTTAPGEIGRYGFDPATDKTTRQTTTYTIQQKTFNGSRFNDQHKTQTLPSVTVQKGYTQPLTSPRYTTPTITVPKATTISSSSFRRR